MKKSILLVVVFLFSLFQAKAVLKEKDLAQTLGVLRAELERTYNETTIQYARFEQRNAEQHANLIAMMQKSNQIALMLYSQNSDFTLDMAYACQAATEQYRSLRIRHLPFAKIKEKLTSEIERYDELIQALQDLPPRVRPNGELMKLPDSIRAMMPKMIVDTSKMAPFLLDEQGMEDREVCLDYATALRDKYQQMLDLVVRDEEHYSLVSKRVKELNDYAMARYETIQKNIFVNGDDNYFTTLKRFSSYLKLAKKDVNDKYKPLKEKSQWRGPVVIGISLFMLFYILVASVLSYAIVRWILPKRVRERLSDKKKRPLLTVACGVAIFAISIMVAKMFMKHNFVLMAINLMITFAWLMEAILLSLLIRLKDRQVKSGILTYLPFLTMAFLVIVFRIILIPNNLVNLIYPPILLGFTFWQIFVIRHRIKHLPSSDMIYAVISLLAMIGACVASWFGFVLMAVEVMIWWTIQLAAIQTITCFYDLAIAFKRHRLVRRIAEDKDIKIRSPKEEEKWYKKWNAAINKGEYIAKTWFFDFVYRCLLPCFAVLSVPASIYFAAGIFEMSSFCIQIFFYPFINKPTLIQLSLYKICLVLELFFLFRYLNYVIKAFYHLFKITNHKDADTPINITLPNNVITIIVWGVFIIASLVILQVPGSGISIVMAGLATGLGFAMKDLLENLVYGITLMSGRLRVGDFIECEGIQGKVDSINYQSTQLVTYDGSVITFQNATLFTKNFQNLTRNHGYVRAKIPVGVSYGTNVAQVREMLIARLKPLIGKKEDKKMYIDPKKGFSVFFSGFGESSVDLLVVCWVLVEEKFSYIPKIQETIYNTLNENNISIPFPQRDLHIMEVNYTSDKKKQEE
ncbi:MAG: mechanosensitive ion channel family protein [Bacteroidales bacterium]|nr:mechanosensitive ion channel family protein [Bacteroidales bacterium]